MPFLFRIRNAAGYEGIMKIAYATQFAADDLHAWSGTVYFMREALRQAGAEIVTIDGLKEHGRISGKLQELVYQKLTGKTFMRSRRPSTLDGYARQVEARVKGTGAKVVFSPSCFPIARMKPGLPTVFWADACFAGMVDFYPYTSNLCQRTLREGNATEQQALDRCSLAIYASDWAAKTALEQYDLDPEKVKVVPYGANVDRERTRGEVEVLVDARSLDHCELLFIGVDWQRKGGDVALAAAADLNRRGLPTILHVVGCEPPRTLPDFVVRHGFVSKQTEAGRAKLDRLFGSSHFLIVPSRAECYGLVFAEASSYGLPSLATDTGGISSVVTEGINGHLFSLAEDGTGIATRVIDLMENPASYRELALSAHAEYERRLNWRVAGAAVLDLLRR